MLQLLLVTALQTLFQQSNKNQNLLKTMFPALVPREGKKVLILYVPLVQKKQGEALFSVTTAYCGCTLNVLIYLKKSPI